MIMNSSDTAVWNFGVDVRYDWAQDGWIQSRKYQLQIATGDAYGR